MAAQDPVRSQLHAADMSRPPCFHYPREGSFPALVSVHRMCQRWPKINDFHHASVPLSPYAGYEALMDNWLTDSDMCLAS
jgi:hypothetical protein